VEMQSANIGNGVQFNLLLAVLISVFECLVEAEDSLGFGCKSEGLTSDRPGRLMSRPAARCRQSAGV
jgi:hypothetical protein